MKTYIYQTRKNLGITIDELSEITGLHSEIINEAENGIYSPTFDTICKLAKAMDVSPDKLISCESDDYIY